MPWWAYTIIGIGVCAMEYVVAKTITEDEREAKREKEAKKVCPHFDGGNCVYRQDGLPPVMQPCGTDCCDCNEATRAVLEACHG